MLELFLIFLKIGAFTFGGGYAMIAQIKEVIVEKKGWLTDDELTEVIAIAESTPGPIAINLATFVGFKRNGFFGSLFATLGVVLPSMTILFLISLFLEGFLENKYVAYAFVGIKCTVAFLIVKAGVEMLIKLEKKPVSVLLFLLVFSLMIVFDVFAISFSSIWFILLGAVVGLTLFAVKEGRK